MAKRLGSIQDRTFVGQNPKRRADLEAKLIADFEPKDVLEEIWLSEIATLTVTIEYYRYLEVYLNYALANKKGLETDYEDERRLEIMSASEGKKPMTYHMPLQRPCFKKALGEFNDADLKKINTVIDMITKLRRERERIYNQFERKRRPALINAVRYQEIPPNGEAAIDNLAD